MGRETIFQQTRSDSDVDFGEKPQMKDLKSRGQNFVLHCIKSFNVHRSYIIISFRAKTSYLSAKHGVFRHEQCVQKLEQVSSYVSLFSLLPWTFVGIVVALSGLEL